MGKILPLNKSLSSLCLLIVVCNGAFHACGCMEMEGEKRELLRGRRGYDWGVSKIVTYRVREVAWL